MVGVPGKSKGCSTCRRRKKGCDQKRPICGQCSASGYVCGGYQRDLTFVLHPASKTVEKALFLPTKRRPPISSLTPSMERSAVVSQCQSMFFDVYMPQGKCVVSDPFTMKCGRPASWTSLIKDFMMDEVSLEMAFTAFSISRVGRNKDNPQLVKASTQFYGKALKNLQEALYDPSRMHSEQVLTTSLILGLYESFEGLGGKSVGWVSHAQGAARILELRGPENHVEEDTHALFIGTRLPITYAAIIRRKSTFLSDDAWLTIPWRKEHKSGLDRLIDITTRIPGLLEQFDLARSQTPSNLQFRALQSCLTLCRQLQTSLSTWNTIRRPNSEPIPLQYESLTHDDDYPFERQLIYENHLFLSANLIYWSSTLVIVNTISEVEMLLVSLGHHLSGVMSSTAYAMKEAQECATNIAQSIQYCLWPEMGDLGIDYVQFPMCLAFEFFMKSNNLRVCSWMSQRAKQMSNNLASSTVSYFGNVDLYHNNSSESVPFDVAASDFSSSINLAPPTFEALPADHLDFAAALASNASFAGQSSSDTPSISHSKSIASEAAATIAADITDFNGDSDWNSDYNSQQFRFGDVSNPLFPGDTQYSRFGTTDIMSGMNMRIPFDEGDFTFVQENPSKYYIDRSELAIANQA